jgi:outer membrane protein OmpA-like peptidoglycan-associated protein
MKKDPSLKVELDGHSDVVGMERYNKNLSVKRAERVKTAMVKAGIAANRITVKGFGSDKPLAANDQEKEGRELNRRVEFKLIK